MLKKINVKQLTVGMYVHDLCTPWTDRPSWRTGFLVKTEEDLRRLGASGIAEVWIDVTKGTGLAAGETEAQIEARVDQVLSRAVERQEAPEPVALTEEIKRAAQICANSKDAVVYMFEEARMGKAISAAAAGDLVDEISSSVKRNPDALIALARLKSIDDYTYLHSVAVCALAVAVAQQMELDQRQIHEVGMAGLLHDVGKAVIPHSILNSRQSSATKNSKP